MPEILKYNLDKILDLLIDTVFVANVEGKFVFISASCENLLGYTPEELIGRNMVELILPEDLERTLNASKSIVNERSLVHFENRYIHKDGRVIDIMWSAHWSETEQLRFAVARDITEHKHAERKQRVLYDISEAASAAENLETLYQHIHRIIASLLPADLLFVTQYDQANNTLLFPYFSSALSKKHEPQALNSESWLSKIIHLGQAQRLSSADCTLDELNGIEAYQKWLGVPLLSHKGTLGALVMARGAGCQRYTERDKDLLQFASTQIALTIERKQAEARLHHLASHDPLTDLPNRMLFQDRFEMALKMARRGQTKVALIYLDLNKFKQVNDNFGHQVGDQLLCEIAIRISGCVRRSDTVARMGGDEFAVLVTNIQPPTSIEAIIENIHKTIERPFELGEFTLKTSASIGVALYPDQGENIQQLIHHADEQMYLSKMD
jgi:diguanylate cyclase (GGDEF)-like protein/PAS domain S-box-containing protein